ncbi:hypothetical protein ES288_A12G107300v1 [Gossypium darwinii]|uniref:Zinc finger Sec23/Sec24-type domain-containing protein n=1 Tax=Gossypium darwinii TaxID=34276 RepID=A0A5D2E932_GOSDA|nr:hypothetical protein ES288_A12G107300v1 [Gossypium darwinii]
MEGFVAFSHTSNTCPPCLCDYSSQPLLTIPEVDKKVMPGMENEGSNLSRAEEQANEAFKGGMLEFTVQDLETFCLNRSCFDLLWILVLNILPKVVDFWESGLVRWSRCKGYINPFMKFIDQERKFICNLCVNRFGFHITLFSLTSADDPQELEKYSDDNKELAWMFFVDGCAILQAVYMRYGNDDDDGKMFIKNNLLTFVYLDQFLLENQLAFSCS